MLTWWIGGTTAPVVRVRLLAGMDGARGEAEVVEIMGDSVCRARWLPDGGTGPAARRPSPPTLADPGPVRMGDEEARGGRQAPAPQRAVALVWPPGAGRPAGAVAVGGQGDGQPQLRRTHAGLAVDVPDLG